VAVHRATPASHTEVHIDREEEIVRFAGVLNLEVDGRPGKGTRAVKCDWDITQALL
jgi:hypothetical protein